jgi:NADH-quinone oxidoreductase subunit N
VDPKIVPILTGFAFYVLPELVLSAVACMLFLAGTWRARRDFCGLLALLGLALAGVMTWASAEAAGSDLLNNALFATPLYLTSLSLLVKTIALVGGGILLLFAWDEVPEAHAGEHHGCLLLIVAGVCLTSCANDLVSLFLSLELISIPTYVLLYMVRTDPPAQEAAMKYFLLSVFSSALMLFGFSYLYGLSGSTNLPAVLEAASSARGTQLRAVPLLALVMVVAGLGFKITAVPFHFYAPDVYQGTSTSGAALLAFLPKVAGFVALVRVLGFIPLGSPPLADQVSVLLWIMAAVTMTLGNVIGLLQDNLKRLLAYSGVAHGGYMLIGLAVAPRLPEASALMGGVGAVFFYLIAYGVGTIGAFAVIGYLNTPERPVETVDDLAGLGRSQPGMALVMALFLFSLMGIPPTVGFMGKFLIFIGALSVPIDGGNADQSRLFTILATVAAINAAIAAWYYLRVASVMFLRDSTRPVTQTRTRPVLLAIGLCAVLTVVAGVWSDPFVKGVRSAVEKSVKPGFPEATQQER